MIKVKSIVFTGLIVLSVFMLVCLSPAQAQTVIRDAEIEDLLHEYLRPITKAAGIPPKSVELILVQSPVVNAFVAGGMNIFLYTGLIQETETPLELVAVLAHETGHIAGGHLIRLSEQIEQAQTGSIVAMILGGILAAGTGQANSGVAGSLAAQTFLERTILKYTRIHESAADQASFSYLKDAGISLKGTVDFFKKLQSQEGRSVARQNEYRRTHPLTQSRVEAAEQQYQQTVFMNLNDLSHLQERHDRMKAKILAYTYPKQALILHTGLSITDLYAQAVAYYRLSQIDDRFLPLMNELLRTEPDNPYFWELKGQALFENGRVDEALQALGKASEMLDGAPLINTIYAHALVEHGGKDEVQKAIFLLKDALKRERPTILRYRLLGRAYNILNDLPRAKLYQAEENLLKGETDLAIRIARSLETVFQEGTAEWIRIQDILYFSDQKKKE